MKHGNLSTPDKLSVRITLIPFKEKRMKEYNKEKARQLGMPIGTATARLKKSIMFELVKQLNLDICFVCQKKIESEEEFSIEHKTPWLYSKNPTELFFSLENIAFSHLKCNVSSRRKLKEREIKELICMTCKKKFVGRMFRIRHKIKKGQIDFYCSKKCSNGNAGKGYGRLRD